MNNKTLYILSPILFITGALFVAIHKDLIIFRSPFHTSVNTQEHNVSKKQSITLFYWHNNKYNSEKTDILATDKPEENIHKIVNCWLNLLDEEKIIEKTALQTALISDTNELFLSFDRNFLNPEDATHQKLLLIEGLLKTLRENNVKIPKLNFLVHHQPMQDTHLDFANTWPLEGYLK